MVNPAASVRLARRPLISCKCFRTLLVRCSLRRLIICFHSPFYASDVLRGIEGECHRGLRAVAPCPTRVREAQRRPLDVSDLIADSEQVCASTAAAEAYRRIAFNPARSNSNRPSSQSVPCGDRLVM
jgi:hypothetical protein